MKKIKFIIGGLLLSSLIFSCDDYLDINEHPNKIHQEDIRPDQMLPGAQVLSYRVQARSMALLGNRIMQNWYGNINGVTGLQNSDEYTLLLDNESYTGIWDGFYLYVNNFQQLINYDSENYDNHKAIAYIMKSFYMQYVVDLYGDCPYSEAFLGSENIAPAYDDDALIYVDLVNNIDVALDLIANADDNDAEVSAEDVMYAGDMDSWVNFAKLVKMRLLLRQSEMTDSSVQSYLQAEFDEITASGLPSAAVAPINPGYSTGALAQMNPFNSMFFNNSGAQTNNQNRASGYIADFLQGGINGVVDPRATYLYETDSNGDIIGAYQGETSGYETVTLSQPLFFFEADSDGIVMSEAEASFILSEAIERGYIAGDAKAAFDAGITASFNFLGAPIGSYLTDIDAVSGLGWNGGNTIEAIMTQKWLASNSINPTESFIDYTRTGYPDLPLATTAAYTHRPYRLMYPTSEYTANTANVPVLSQASLFTQGPFLEKLKIDIL